MATSAERPPATQEFWNSAPATDLAEGKGYFLRDIHDKQPLASDRCFMGDLLACQTTAGPNGQLYSVSIYRLRDADVAILIAPPASTTVHEDIKRDFVAPNLKEPERPGPICIAIPLALLSQAATMLRDTAQA